MSFIIISIEHPRKRAQSISDNYARTPSIIVPRDCNGDHWTDAVFHRVFAGGRAVCGAGGRPSRVDRLQRRYAGKADLVRTSCSVQGSAQRHDRWTSLSGHRQRLEPRSPEVENRPYRRTGLRPAGSPASRRAKTDRCETRTIGGGVLSMRINWWGVVAKIAAVHHAHCNFGRR